MWVDRVGLNTVFSTENWYHFGGMRCLSCPLLTTASALVEDSIQGERMTSGHKREKRHWDELSETCRRRSNRSKHTQTHTYSLSHSHTHTHSTHMHACDRVNIAIKSSSAASSFAVPHRTSKGSIVQFVSSKQANLITTTITACHRHLNAVCCCCGIILIPFQSTLIRFTVNGTYVRPQLNQHLIKEFQCSTIQLVAVLAVMWMVCVCGGHLSFLITHLPQQHTHQTN